MLPTDCGQAHKATCPLKRRISVDAQQSRVTLPSFTGPDDAKIADTKQKAGVSFDAPAFFPFTTKETYFYIHLDTSISNQLSQQLASDSPQIAALENATLDPDRDNLQLARLDHTQLTTDLLQLFRRPNSLADPHNLVEELVVLSISLQ